VRLIIEVYPVAFAEFFALTDGSASGLDFHGDDQLLHLTHRCLMTAEDGLRSTDFGRAYDARVALAEAFLLRGATQHALQQRQHATAIAQASKDAARLAEALPTASYPLEQLGASLGEEGVVVEKDGESSRGSLLVGGGEGVVPLWDDFGFFCCVWAREATASRQASLHTANAIPTDRWEEAQQCLEALLAQTTEDASLGDVRADAFSSLSRVHLALAAQVRASPRLSVPSPAPAPFHAARTVPPPARAFVPIPSGCLFSCQTWW
jgi:hypothetical protein